jgi:hypothetical protein
VRHGSLPASSSLSLHQGAARGHRAPSPRAWRPSPPSMPVAIARRMRTLHGRCRHRRPPVWHQVGPLDAAYGRAPTASDVAGGGSPLRAARTCVRDTPRAVCLRRIPGPPIGSPERPGGLLQASPGAPTAAPAESADAASGPRSCGSNFVPSRRWPWLAGDAPWTGAAGIAGHLWQSRRTGRDAAYGRAPAASEVAGGGSPSRAAAHACRHATRGLPCAGSPARHMARLGRPGGLPQASPGGPAVSPADRAGAAHRGRLKGYACGHLRTHEAGEKREGASEQ